MPIAAPIEVGDRRAYYVNGSFMVPWGTSRDEAKIERAKEHYIKKFIERMERAGEQFERLVSVTQIPEKVLHERHGEVEEWIIRAVFSRRAERLVVRDLPDDVVRHLLTEYPQKYNERMVS